MRDRSRFRRWAGIFGTVAIVASTATGAAAALGQSAASAASGPVATVAADSSPSVTFQNVGGQLANGDGSGSGYNFVVTGWHIGDTLTLTAGTPSGQLNTTFG